MCAQNVPQVALQVWYLSTVKAGDAVALSSIGFSLFSIVVAVLTIATQSKILARQACVCVSVDVTGSGLQPALKGRVKGIRSDVARLLMVDKYVVEVHRPRVILSGGGFHVELSLFVDRSEVALDSILRASVDNGCLAEMFARNWKLSSVPVVCNLRYKERGADQEKGTLIVGGDTMNELQSVQSVRSDSGFADAKDQSGNTVR